MTSLVSTKIGYVIGWQALGRDVNMALDCCARSERFFGHDGCSIVGWEVEIYVKGNRSPYFGVLSAAD